MTENKSTCTNLHINADLIKPENPVQSRISQADKFKDLARQIEADEDEAQWEQRLKRVVKAPKPKANERGGGPDAP